MDDLLREINFVKTYIDDIFIFIRDKEEHADHLKVLMQKLEVAGLKIYSGKSLLFQPEITFLGYHFSKKGIKPHPDRVECLRKLPLPGDHKELRRVLGMFGFYQRCVPSYATVVHSLRVLLNADTFLWKEEHSKAFENLKNEISNCSELSYPHPDAAFTITCLLYTSPSPRD